jgi:hypothetical protein
VHLDTVCGAFKPLYFLKSGYTQVTAKNLKKRVTGEISSIQKDNEDNVFVSFDLQRLYAHFDDLTQPMKLHLAHQFEVVRDNPNEYSPHVLEIATWLKVGNLVFLFYTVNSIFEGIISNPCMISPVHPNLDFHFTTRIEV